MRLQFGSLLVHCVEYARIGYRYYYTWDQNPKQEDEFLW